MGVGGAAGAAGAGPGAGGAPTGTLVAFVPALGPAGGAGMGIYERRYKNSCPRLYRRGL